MKKSFKKIITVVLTMVMLVSSLAGCGKSLSGSYEAELKVLGQSWKVIYSFSGKKVTAESKVTLLGNVETNNYEGTYEIVENEDGSMEITFDFEEESDLFKDGTFTFTEAEDYIKIAGSQYNKVDK